MTQNFGPEARGGACSAQLILSDDADPLPVRDAAGHHGGHVAGSLHALCPGTEARGRILIVEAGPGARFQYQCRDRRRSTASGNALAEELGKRMVLNSVMVGFFTAVTNLLTADAVRKAVADSVPPSFRELNLKAFERDSSTARTRWLASAQSRHGRTGVFEGIIDPFM